MPSLTMTVKTQILFPRSMTKDTTKFLPRMRRRDSDAYSAADDYATGAASDSDDSVWVSFCICGERTGSVFHILFVSSGFLRGGYVTHNLSLLPGLKFYF